MKQEIHKVYISLALFCVGCENMFKIFNCNNINHKSIQTHTHTNIVPKKMYGTPGIYTQIYVCIKMYISRKYLSIPSYYCK